MWIYLVTSQWCHGGGPDGVGGAWRQALGESRQLLLPLPDEVIELALANQERGFGADEAAVVVELCFGEVAGQDGGDSALPPVQVLLQLPRVFGLTKEQRTLVMKGVLRKRRSREISVSWVFELRTGRSIIVCVDSLPYVSPSPQQRLQSNLRLCPEKAETCPPWTGGCTETAAGWRSSPGLLQTTAMIRPRSDLWPLPAGCLPMNMLYFSFSLAFSCCWISASMPAPAAWWRRCSSARAAFSRCIAATQRRRASHSSPWWTGGQTSPRFKWCGGNNSTHQSET